MPRLSTQKPGARLALRTSGDDFRTPKDVLDGSHLNHYFPERFTAMTGNGPVFTPTKVRDSQPINAPATLVPSRPAHPARPGENGP